MSEVKQLDAYFGEYGGMFVPELFVPALEQLEQAYIEALDDPEFHKEFTGLLNDYAGRPTPLTLCKNLVSGTNTKLYLKQSCVQTSLKS